MTDRSNTINMSTSQNVDNKPVPLVQRILALQSRNKRQLQMYEASRTTQSDGNKENSLLSISASSYQNKSAPAEHVFDLSKINDSIANLHSVSASAASGNNVDIISQKSCQKRRPQSKKEKLSVVAEKKLDQENWCGIYDRRSKSAMEDRDAERENQLIRCRSNSAGSKTPRTSSQSATFVGSLVSTPSLQSKHVVVNDRYYMWINLLGKGGSSQVYEVFDETRSEVCALKVVDLGVDPLIRQCYLNEIELLMSLQGSPYVIKMLDYELRECENMLYVVMEKGDIDLATFLKTRRTEIDFSFIKYHWNEMLRCVKVIHDRKIVHSDLKPANFLLVKGTLKLIDFGIAAGIPNDMTAAIKESQMGTLSYMAPEVLQQENVDGKFKIPLKADVWSLGCILYNMVFGRLPFSMKNQIAKISAILNPNHAVDFSGCRDPLLVDVLKRCLVRDVHRRADINELLEHQYLTGVMSPAESQNSIDSGPKLDYLAIARELQNNTPNTIARRLEELTRGSQVNRPEGDGGAVAMKKMLDFDQEL
ncbi:hypothetical protein Angca_009156 [Angiostrongylus cantonensis]|nr:hypothetical protein Angca_009156 [Angiostrongylus cantonensis]